MSNEEIIEEEPEEMVLLVDAVETCLKCREGHYPLLDGSLNGFPCEAAAQGLCGCTQCHGPDGVDDIDELIPATKVSERWQVKPE